MTFKIHFAQTALDDLGWWISNDRKMAVKILTLVTAVSRDPKTGPGKPEPLSGMPHRWSRRINQKDRLVYQINADTVTIVACRFHYDDH